VAAPIHSKFAPWAFVFATGIECSYPKISGKNGTTIRMDQLEKTFHYKHWRQDLALVAELGLHHLRYGPPYFKIHSAPERYDWEFTDLVFAEMKRLNLIPIVDLCHFGVPDWIGNFQNPEWPKIFTEFAGAFATRFPWVQFYTPVNEIYVCAKLSTLNGLWNEQKHNDDRAFVTALKHLCMANLLAMREILKTRTDAIFIQSESAEYFHPGGNQPEILAKTKFENNRRFLALDLLFSNSPCAEMGFFLLENGMTRDELRWFMSHGLSEHIVMGNDFYERNEQVIVPGGGARAAGEIFGWGMITRQYYDRYRRPVMHTETNTSNVEDAPRWLWKEFFNVRQLREEGVPVLGFTWYSLLDQIDWDIALAEDVGKVHPVGLYDLQRRARPVAAAYRELLTQFGSDALIPKSPIFAFHQGKMP
jgi:beta-glucosidase/6-phospho-beta-glucosidase/beta-galactosidase